VLAAILDRFRAHPRDADRPRVSLPKKTAERQRKVAWEASRNEL